MAKLIIDNELIAEEYFSDARLLGIQCALEPHQFIWHINRQFLYDFRYQSGSEIVVTKKSRPFRYPIFQCKEPQQELLHIIYANQYDGEYLLSELRYFDYLWLIKGEMNDDSLPGLILNELKAIGHVQLVTELSNEKIINKTQLVL
ncbi:hypothetical protein BH10BAC3_BH10BAC3_07850 [soil metagenome]